MAKKKNQHTIEHQIINLDIQGTRRSKDVQTIQKNLVQLYKEVFAVQLDKLFTELVPEDIDIQLDKLEIDLGTINFKRITELEQKLIKVFRETAKKAIQKKLKEVQAQNGLPTQRKAKFTKDSIVEYFLLNGHYPSWAKPENGSIRELVDDLLAKKGRSFAQRLFKIGKDKRVRERLHHQFSVDQLEQLLVLMYGEKSAKVRKKLNMIQKRLGKRSEKAVLSAALIYILEQSNTLATITYNERELVQKVIEEVQKRKAAPDVSSKIRPEFKDDYTNLQLLRYFLDHGAIPAWADVDSKRSLQDLFEMLLEQQLAGVQRILERNIGNSTFVRRLVLQFPTQSILKLMEPTPAENVEFVESSIGDFEFLSKDRQNIKRTISKGKIKQIVLETVLQYFFAQKRTKFVKKTFINQVLEGLSEATNTSTETLVKETYKSVRRKQNNSYLRPVLEDLDHGIQEKVAAERSQLQAARREYRQLERRLSKLRQKQLDGNLSSAEQANLRKLNQELKQLEQTMEELEDLDMPLELELVLKERQSIKSNLKRLKDEDRNRLEKRLERTEKTFFKLQNSLKKEVATLLDNKKKLLERTGSLAEKRIKRVNSRLSKYQRAIQAVLGQLLLDQQELTLLLTDLNRALRSNISTEEKQLLRQERRRLQDELIQINTYIELLETESKKLEEALAEAMVVVETGEDPDLAPSRTSKLDALLFMLKYGATPWWAEDFPKQSIEEMVLEFVQKSPDKLLKALRQVGKYPVVWERLVNQLSTRSIERLLGELFPNAARTIIAQSNLLSTIHFSQGFPHLNNVESKRFRWAVILEYTLGQGQGFQIQQFTKAILLQTARLYSISPKKFLDFSNNIIQNRGGDLEQFLDPNKILEKDKEVEALERELRVYAQEQADKDAGLFLDDRQKMELLADFLSSGNISDKAKELNYTTINSFENLLLDQIQQNRRDARYVIFNLLRLSNSRKLIIESFSEDTFWEIVYLVKPKGFLPLKRYFTDFKKIFKDRELYTEKDVLFSFFLAQQQAKFDINSYIKTLLVFRKETSGRKPLLILNEWKQALKGLGRGAQSSMLLSVLMLEVDALKQEQRQTTDSYLRMNLEERTALAAEEYTDLSQEMTDVLYEETTEAQGIEEEEHDQDRLEELLTELENELKGLRREATSTRDTLKIMDIKRKIVQYEVQIKLLSQKRPPLVRKLEQEIKTLQATIQTLEKEAKDNQPPVVEDVILAEEPLEQTLIEQQLDVLKNIPKQAPSVLRTLPNLFKQLEPLKEVQVLFVLRLQAMAEQLPDGAYKTQLVALLATAPMATIRLDKLREDQTLLEAQQELVQKIGQVAPVLLWQEWESIDAQIDPNVSPQLQAKQADLYQVIRRYEQQNFIAYVENMQLMQDQLETAVSEAITLEQLEDLQEQLEMREGQQLRQLDELLSAVRDDDNRKDFEGLRRNLQRRFVRLSNQRIRQSQTLLSLDEEAVQQQISIQKGKIENLELQKERALDAISKKENQSKEAPTKRKREKQAPKPRPVDEPLQIYNAGLVLIWPYLSRLFGILKYTENKAFVSEETQLKAIHVLQYLATGKTEAPENELLLNKIFCGYPINEPVPFSVEFTPQELEIADGLLKGVLANWPKMKNMSPDALRTTFLMRTGTIKEEEDKWTLIVQKNAFDVLLKTVPWGFNFVKFSWAPKFVTVEWPLM